MKSKSVSVVDILNLLNKFDISIYGIQNYKCHYKVSSLKDADEDSIIWFKGNDSSALVTCRSNFILCANSLEIPSNLLEFKTFVKTNDPRLLMSELISACFTEKIEAQIHPTAVIHPEAIIGKNAFIGPFVYIGKVEIGNDVVIWGHAYLHDDVILGNNVEIHAGCVIGEIGSGFTKNKQNEYVKFPHIGSVIIEDNVEIGALTYINRGSLGDTIIKKGAKIGNAVCIGHNVYIGENTLVIANTVVAGSAKVGKSCWIAHSCSIRNGIQIGDNVFIGMGSVVTSNCASDTVLFGNPAKDQEEIKKWKAIQQELINNKYES